jgi:hypothetical protein
MSSLKNVHLEEQLRQLNDSLGVSQRKNKVLTQQLEAQKGTNNSLQQKLQSEQARYKQLESELLISKQNSEINLKDALLTLEAKVREELRNQFATERREYEHKLKIEQSHAIEQEQAKTKQAIQQIQAQQEKLLAEQLEKSIAEEKMGYIFKIKSYENQIADNTHLIKQLQAQLEEYEQREESHNIIKQQLQAATRRISIMAEYTTIQQGKMRNYKTLLKYLAVSKFVSDIKLKQTFKQLLGKCIDLIITIQPFIAANVLDFTSAAQLQSFQYDLNSWSKESSRIYNFDFFGDSNINMATGLSRLSNQHYVFDCLLAVYEAQHLFEQSLLLYKESSNTNQKEVKSFLDRNSQLTNHCMSIEKQLNKYKRQNNGLKQELQQKVERLGTVEQQFAIVLTKLNGFRTNSNRAKMLSNNERLRRAKLIENYETSEEKPGQTEVKQHKISQKAKKIKQIRPQTAGAAIITENILEKNNFPVENEETEQPLKEKRDKRESNGGNDLRHAFNAIISADSTKIAAINEENSATSNHSNNNNNSSSSNGASSNKKTVRLDVDHKANELQSPVHSSLLSSSSPISSGSVSPSLSSSSPQRHRHLRTKSSVNSVALERMKAKDEVMQKNLNTIQNVITKHRDSTNNTETNTNIDNNSITITKPSENHTGSSSELNAWKDTEGSISSLQPPSPKPSPPSTKRNATSALKGQVTAAEQLNNLFMDRYHDAELSSSRTARSASKIKAKSPPKHSNHAQNLHLPPRSGFKLRAVSSLKREAEEMAEIQQWNDREQRDQSRIYSLNGVYSQQSGQTQKIRPSSERKMANSSDNGSGLTDRPHTAAPNKQTRFASLVGVAQHNSVAAAAGRPQTARRGNSVIQDLEEYGDEDF